MTRLPPSSEVNALISERIGADTSPASADPSDVFELVLALEEAYNIDISDEQAAALATRSDVFALMKGMSPWSERASQLPPSSAHC